ncbi:MAG: uroporphyrinogen decarboxylase family protein, partial [Gammaproteobacteria bacterium]
MSREHDLVRALYRKPVSRRPVWIMRQAGRYLPEYRAIRERAGSFLTLMKTPELACEVTLQPLRRFDLDAAILFADILTIPDAMGLGLEFVAGEGPRFRNPIERREQVSALPPLDPEADLSYVLDTVRAVSRELDGKKPLIGFSGGPWTLAAYMLEGRSGGGEFRRARAALHTDPQLAEALVQHLVPAITAYLAAQARAGTNALMIFESWAGLLTPTGFEHYCRLPLGEIVKGLKADPVARDKPLIVFPKGAGQHAAALADLGPEALGLD